MTDRRIRILLVEDDEADAMLVKKVIASVESTVFDVAWAQSLPEAMTRLSSETFNVILLDPGLPNCEGLDALQAVRKAAEDIAIIVLTGWESDDAAASSIEMGAQEYLLKRDITGNGLVRAMRSALQRHRGQPSPGNEFANAVHRSANVIRDATEALYASGLDALQEASVDLICREIAQTLSEVESFREVTGPPTQNA